MTLPFIEGLHMNEKSMFIVPDHVMMRVVGSDAVIVDLEGGMYFGLNEVGAEIWKHLAAGASLAEIEGAVMAEFDVDHQTVYADVRRIVRELLESHLITEAGVTG
jgi:hypothetical protein